LGPRAAEKVVRGMAETGVAKETRSMERLKASETATRKWAARNLVR